EVDLRQVTPDARPDVDRLDRFGPAGEVLVIRDFTDEGLTDRHRGRRRSGCDRRFVTAGQCSQERPRGAPTQQGKDAMCHRRQAFPASNPWMSVEHRVVELWEAVTVIFDSGHGKKLPACRGDADCTGCSWNALPRPLSILWKLV